MTQPSCPTPRRWLVLATAAPLVWASCLVVLYAALSLGCEAGWQRRASLGGTSVLTLVLVAAWLAHGAALALLARWCWRQPRGTGRALALGLAAFCAFGIAWLGWPVVVLQPCVGPELPAAFTVSPPA